MITTTAGTVTDVRDNQVILEHGTVLTLDGNLDPELRSLLVHEGGKGKQRPRLLFTITDGVVTDLKDLR